MIHEARSRAKKMKNPFVFTLALAVVSSQAFAADPETILGKKGKVLLEENFAGNGLPSGWTKNTGTIVASDGVLRITELASDKHAGAFRKALPMKDLAIQLDFKFEQAKMFHIGFDPAPGELKKKGHLYSVVINPEKISILEHNDKANPDSKPKTLGAKSSDLKNGQWYKMLLENKGDEVLVHIDGVEMVRAKSDDFRVKKPGIVLRVMGADKDGVCIDNMTVWELN